MIKLWIRLAWPELADAGAQSIAVPPFRHRCDRNAERRRYDRCLDFHRFSQKDHVTFTYIGAGFAGLCTGAGLVEAGLDPSEFRFVEKGGDVGGT